MNTLYGMLGGFFIALAITYWQFIKSVAGYRVRKVVRATKDIIDEIESTNSYTGPLQNRYRYSFGVIIDRCATSFGTRDIPKVVDKYPALIQKDNDGWYIFNLYVRPVLEDISSYSFISFFSFLPLMSQLNKLINLCKQIENVTGELDAIRLIDKNKEVFIFNNGSLKIKETTDVNLNTHIEKLMTEYIKLEKEWKKWLKSIGK